KLRFDFTHPQALTREEREDVERRVNERIFENLPVRIFETPIEEARNLGAMMLFGEKYGDVVRVVDVGGWSIELCGGTHVRSTAEIGPFAILAEASVGAGARRIEAVTSGEAFALLRERAREADELRGELERARREKRKPEATAQYEITDRVDGVVFAETSDVQPGPLRDLSDRIRQQEKAEGAIVASITEGRVHIVVNLAESIGVDAAALANEMGQIVGGRGGGKPTLAQAGGNNPEAMPQAIAAGKQRFG
ncbi:MAG TPA: DHHA1 domain-containing protein, partial [Gaiellaceae bacterium]|nr:DHHA1 domain-containing protein [Gaiellaceae bacterium]